MTAPDLYRLTNGQDNATLAHPRTLTPQQVYYEPQALMFHQIAVGSKHAQFILTPRTSVSPPVSPIFDASVLVQQLTHTLRPIPSAESVYVRETLVAFECWIIVNNSTESERFHLYDLEWQTMERKIPGKGIKFHLIDRLDKPLAEIVTFTLPITFAPVAH